MTICTAYAPLDGLQLRKPKGLYGFLNDLITRIETVEYFHPFPVLRSGLDRCAEKVFAIWNVDKGAVDGFK